MPTVLQLDLVAAGATWGPGGMRITAVEVGAPVVLLGEDPRVVEVVGRPAADGRSRDIVLRSRDGATHLRATLAPIDRGRVPAPDVSAAAVSLPGTVDDVYPPMFHGPACQVVAGFGRAGNALVTRLPAQLTRWAVGEQPGRLPSHLLELVLQTCGVWELAETGRMMRPSRIDEVVVRYAQQVITPETRVRVRPRSRRSQGERVFDGVALDGAGRELLRVRGYRPVDLGTPAATAATSRIRVALGSLPVHLPQPVPDDQGASR